MISFASVSFEKFFLFRLIKTQNFKLTPKINTIHTHTHTHTKERPYHKKSKEQKATIFIMSIQNLEWKICNNKRLNHHKASKAKEKSFSQMIQKISSKKIHKENCT